MEVREEKTIIADDYKKNYMLKMKFCYVKFAGYTF